MGETGGKVLRADEEVPIGTLLKHFRAPWWKVIALSLLTGTITLLVLFLLPNIFESSGTVVPTTEDGKPNFSLGALASSIGLTVGGPTKIEDLESLFKSRELTVRVFRKYNPWPLVFPDSFDPATGKLRPGWRERISGVRSEPVPPGDWDALRAVEKRLTVSVSRKLGTLSVSFESRSAAGSRDVVSYYLEEAKSRLQEKALERATRNKGFLETHISRTVDPIVRERLYTLYSQEVEKEMLARNREQFGFTILDPPMVPDRKSRPKRSLNAVAATLISFPVWAWLLARARRRSRTDPSGGAA
ncbi:MAG: hypothetical protein E4H29_05245 [Deltaproteobacteria bacterium]|nr:MAG: hypothetical protein E4H29_05245 [Deltaproteobacteria bacterium]